MKLSIIYQWLCLFLSLLIISMNQTKGLAHEAKSPFFIPQHQSCQQLASALLSQLTIWQYSGYIYSSKSSGFIAMLSNNSTWITLTSQKDLPLSLHPWLITQMSTNQIDWLVALPDYCESQLTITMKFLR